jgi:hypothetical protein
MQQQGIASPSTPGISLVHHNHNLRGLIWCNRSTRT